MHKCRNNFIKHLRSVKLNSGRNPRQIWWGILEGIGAEGLDGAPRAVQKGRSREIRAAERLDSREKEEKAQNKGCHFPSPALPSSEPGKKKLINPINGWLGFKHRSPVVFKVLFLVLPAGMEMLPRFRAGRRILFFLFKDFDGNHNTNTVIFRLFPSRV